MATLKGNDIIRALDEPKNCGPIIEWIKDNEDLTIFQLWNLCSQGDLMMSLAIALGLPKKQIVMAACQCARLSLKFIPAEEKRPIKAIETAEKWCRNEAIMEQVIVVADAAYAIDYSVVYAESANIAYCAANAVSDIE